MRRLALWTTKNPNDQIEPALTAGSSQSVGCEYTSTSPMGICVPSVPQSLSMSPASTLTSARCWLTHATTSLVVDAFLNAPGLTLTKS